MASSHPPYLPQVWFLAPHPGSGSRVYIELGPTGDGDDLQKHRKQEAAHSTGLEPRHLSLNSGLASYQLWKLQ